MNRRSHLISLFVAFVVIGCGETERQQEDITIISGDVVLKGTIVAPTGAGKHPAIVLIHGSGPDSRENPYYGMLTDAFVRRGFAVLTYDKRGSGASTGDWRTVAFSAIIDDAVAAANALRRHRWADSSNTGVWGGSEGGAIAPEVALRTNLAFVIMQSAPAVTMAEQNLHQSLHDPGLRRQMEVHAIVRDSTRWPRTDNWWYRWYRTKMDYTPIPALQRLRAPVLAIWGERDVLVPVEKSRALVIAARRPLAISGDTTIVVRQADHTLYVNGARSLLRTSIRNRPVHLNTIAKWAQNVRQQH